METALSIHQQQQLLSEREHAWQHSAKQLDTVERLEKRPYFARVDFKENGEEKPETIYIGLGSFADKDDHSWFTIGVHLFLQFIMMEN